MPEGLLRNELAQMTITECDIPTSSALQRQLIDAAYFWDSYRAPQTRPQANMVDIFFDIFGHHPSWMKALLIIRNKVAAWCGLDAATASEIINVEPKAQYAVGDKIGPWPIYTLTEGELVAGRDNKHLDFRLSLLRVSDDGVPSVVVSTICTVHNLAGKIYLFFIIPFHRWGVKRLIARAILSGRL
jgi:Protein of unknown function (DUF2867)